MRKIAAREADRFVAGARHRNKLGKAFEEERERILSRRIIKTTGYRSAHRNPRVDGSGIIAKRFPAARRLKETGLSVSIPSSEDIYIRFES